MSNTRKQPSSGVKKIVPSRFKKPDIKKFIRLAEEHDARKGKCGVCHKVIGKGPIAFYSDGACHLKCVGKTLK